MTEIATPSTGRVLWIDFGKLVRFVFFALWFGAFFLVGGAFDWSARHTPFAQLTLDMLGDYALKVIGVVSYAGIGFAWAFGSGPRHYGAWATFGVLWLAAAAAVDFFIK
jgi:hypothetical protein